MHPSDCPLHDLLSMPVSIQQPPVQWSLPVPLHNPFGFNGTIVFVVGTSSLLTPYINPAAPWIISPVFSFKSTVKAD